MGGRKGGACPRRNSCKKSLIKRRTAPRVVVVRLFKSSRRLIGQSNVNARPVLPRRARPTPSLQESTPPTATISLMRISPEGLTAISRVTRGVHQGPSAARLSSLPLDPTAVPPPPPSPSFSRRIDLYPATPWKRDKTAGKRDNTVNSCRALAICRTITSASTRLDRGAFEIGTRRRGVACDGTRQGGTNDEDARIRGSRVRLEDHQRRSVLEAILYSLDVPLYN